MAAKRYGNSAQAVRALFRALEQPGGPSPEQIELAACKVDG